LPLGLHHQQDNCGREGKNQLMLRFLIMLVALGIFRWCVLAFQRSGHSHGELDAIFGQVALAIAMAIFDNPDEVVELLSRTSIK
jgi:hypothetical protein